MPLIMLTILEDPLQVLVILNEMGSLYETGTTGYSYRVGALMDRPNCVVGLHINPKRVGSLRFPLVLFIDSNHCQVNNN